MENSAVTQLPQVDSLPDGFVETTTENPLALHTPLQAINHTGESEIVPDACVTRCLSSTKEGLELVLEDADKGCVEQDTPVPEVSERTSDCNSAKDQPGVDGAVSDPQPVHMKDITSSEINDTQKSNKQASPLNVCGNSTSVAALESPSLKRSRSGRLLMPSLDFWRNQKAVYDRTGQVISIQNGPSVPEISSRGSKSKSKDHIEIPKQRRIKIQSFEAVTTNNASSPPH